MKGVASDFIHYIYSILVYEWESGNMMSDSYPEWPWIFSLKHEEGAMLTSVSLILQDF
ncbi:MAG: hypothetical protein HQL31_10250 [Planctomycetes bacterium]|nr:hypothetical protein [Planctomycetota bacterium]